MDHLRRKYWTLAVLAALTIGFAYGAAWLAERLVRHARGVPSRSPVGVLPLPPGAPGSNAPVTSELAQPPPAH